MAWTRETITVADGSVRVSYTETLTLPNATGTGYSSEFDFAAPDLTTETRFLNLEAVVSGIAGGNIDIDWIGVTKAGGNKATLKATVVPQIGDTTLTVGRVDLNSTDGFAAAYYFAHTVDANESANTITYRIWIS